MADVRLYINNQEADISNDQRSQIATTYTVADIRDISKTKSSTSKTIRIPATAKNRKIFGFAEDVHSLISFNNSVRSIGRIEVNGTVIIEGSIKLSKPVIDGQDKITEYHINILSGLADWKVNISKLNIRDLDFSEYNHVYDLDNQILSESIDGAEGTLADRFIVYPLIDYGKFEGYRPHREVVIQDRKPAWNVYTILHKIFNNQGFTIVSDFIESDFFKRLYMPFTNEKLYKAQGEDTANQFRVRMSTNAVYNTGYLANQPQFIDQLDGDPVDGYKLFTDKIAFNDESSAGYFDNPSAFLPASSVPNFTGNFATNYNSFFGGFYTAPLRSKQRFTAKISGSMTLDFDLGNVVNKDGYNIYPPDEINLAISIRVNANNRIALNTVTLLVSPPFLSLITTDTVSFETTLESGFVDLEAGDTVAVFFDFIWKNGGEAREGFKEVNGVETLPMRVSNVNSNLTINAGSEFLNEFDLELKPEGVLDVNSNLPDIEQLKLIKGLRHLFNLYFYTDTQQRKVYIEPRDDFYDRQAIDWRGKVDVNSDIEINYLGDQYHRLIRKRYKDDSADFPVDDFEKQAEEGFVLASYTTEIEHIFAKEGRQEDENPVFAPTIMDTPYQLNWINNRIPKMWRNFKDDEEIPEFDTNFKDRILYYAGLKDISTSDFLWRNVPFRLDFNAALVNLSDPVAQAFILASDRTTYPYMYSVDDLDKNDNSLYFETRDKSNGLFEKYYRNTFRLINEGRIIKCKMYLKPKDIANLDFRVPVLILLHGEPVYCTINKIINYNPNNEGVTDVELLTVVSTEPLSAIINNPDIQTTKVIQRRVRKTQLQTNLDGVITNVYSDIAGNIEPVYEK